MEKLYPGEETDAVEAVRWALSNAMPLEVLGSATKRTLGRIVEAEAVLDMSGMTGITMYEPSELVMTVRPGTPYGQVKAILDQQGQQLAFEPMDFAPMFATGGQRQAPLPSLTASQPLAADAGTAMPAGESAGDGSSGPGGTVVPFPLDRDRIRNQPPEASDGAAASTPMNGDQAVAGAEPVADGQAGGTIAGLVAVNAFGPRRIRTGAARDHVLGFRCVTGRGDVVQSGGRVMKNVTGYDLSKLITGSFGTLGVMTEITLKVLPKAEVEHTLLILGLDDTAGVRAMIDATKSPHEGSSFAHLPLSAVPYIEQVGTAGTSVTAIRLEGPEVSVVQRIEDMQASLGDGPEYAYLRPYDSAAFWASIRDAVPVALSGHQVWRLSVAPTRAPDVMQSIAETAVPVRVHFFDLAGGLIWLAVDAASDAHIWPIRAAVEHAGGHATLIRAGATVRSAVPVFHPQPKALAALTARVKDSFDPDHILNRGRMWPRATQ